MRPTTICLLALAGAMALAHAPRAAAASRVTGGTPAGSQATAGSFVLCTPSSSTRFLTFGADTIAPPDSTPVLRFIQVCPATACGTGRSPCTGESLLVRVGGSFPNDCWFVRGIDLYVPPTGPPSDPWVRVIVDHGDCPGRACIPGPVEWERRIVIAPRPAGVQTLTVALIELSCGDPIPPPPWPLVTAGFGVGTCDSATTGCLMGNWQHLEDQRGCDLRLAPGESGSVDFTLRTTVGLEGLQGRFEFHPASGLRVTNLSPLGPAAGMKLAWAPTANGAEFVLFSDGPAHIPSTPPDQPPFRLLRFTIVAPPMRSDHEPQPGISPRTQLYARELLGSTAEGKEVRPCPTMTTAPDIAVWDPSANICTGSGCDFNGDGSTDVRDLVGMVHCLTSPVRCAAPYDCNGDSVANVDDVLCCAMKILNIRPCRAADGCGPDSTPQRPDPNVRVQVGLPVETPGGALVPIHIAGADRVGAARLALRLPVDRWRAVRLETPDPSWLTVVGQERGEAVMGAIRIGSPAGPADLDLMLRLEPVDPADAGGELGGLTADVSAIDGVRLIVPIDAPARLLPGPSIEMSENRPDPFTGETRFTLSLPAAADVDLGVFDLGGRRVATLHRGSLAAGVSEFSWNGRGNGGTRLGGGVYFYRAVTNGRTVSRRMVYLGGR